MATTAGDLLLSYLEQQLSELRRHVPGVREEQAESVHQMRVAARRLRSLLASSRKLFSSAESEDLRDELRWLSGALGAARDARVVQARLRELLEAEPQDLTDGQPARRIDENLDDAATAGHQDVLAALDSDRYARLITGLDSLLSAGSLSQRAARPPRKVFKKAIAKDTARMVRAVDGLSAASDGDGDGPSRDARLHEVRKAAKRLRYCAELASTIRGGRGRAGKRARKTAKAARRIQTTLGLHHDTVMSRTLLAELGLRSQPAGQSGFSFGRLHAREESLAADAEADFARMWRKFPGRS